MIVIGANGDTPLKTRISGRDGVGTDPDLEVPGTGCSMRIIQGIVSSQPPILPTATTIDERIDAFIAPLTRAVENLILFPLPIPGSEAQVPFVVLWLVVAALIFTVYFRLINLRGLAHGFRLVRGDHDDPRAAGEVTHFQGTGHCPFRHGWTGQYCRRGDCGLGRRAGGPWSG